MSAFAAYDMPELTPWGCALAVHPTSAFPCKDGMLACTVLVYLLVQKATLSDCHISESCMLFKTCTFYYVSTYECDFFQPIVDI